ncbi:MAG: response regulator [bacterium]|nr:response regulator [bacterium]
MINNILVIEDEKFIGEMYVRSLKIAGYSVDWAVDGNDGLVMLNNKKYDLILVDIMLPEKRGGEIIQELKNSSSISKDAKVVFMTNFQHTPKEREEFLNMADGYFIKSEVVPRKLLEIVSSL